MVVLWKITLDSSAVARCRLQENTGERLKISEERRKNKVCTEISMVTDEIKMETGRIGIGWSL